MEGDVKRHRSEFDGGGEVYSRVHMHQSVFAKIIGKGGAMIKQLRQQYGAHLRGVDLNEDERMLVICGTFAQVMDCFDAVSELVHSSHTHGESANEMFSMSLMIENSRAGKLIGQKGSTMQSLKASSQAIHLQLNKEPMEVAGQPYRLLNITGPVSSVRRAHYYILDLFYDFSALLTRVGGVRGLGPVRGPTLTEMLMLVSTNTPASYSDNRGFGGSEPPSNVIPLSMLNSRTGLHVDVVSQLGEMQAYINQFGLELQVVDKRSSQQSAPMFSPPNAGYHKPAAIRHEPSAGRHKVDDGNSIEFLIPKEQAGAVIGKGGVGLRDIRQETGCKVSLSRDEVNGMRVVTVYHENNEMMEKAKELVLQRAATAVTHDEF